MGCKVIIELLSVPLPTGILRTGIFQYDSYMTVIIHQNAGYSVVVILCKIGVVPKGDPLPTENCSKALSTSEPNKNKKKVETLVPAAT